MTYNTSHCSAFVRRFRGRRLASSRRRVALTLTFVLLIAMQCYVDFVEIKKALALPDRLLLMADMEPTQLINAATAGNRVLREQDLQATQRNDPNVRVTRSNLAVADETPTTRLPKHPPLSTSPITGRFSIMCNLLTL